MYKVFYYQTIYRLEEFKVAASVGVVFRPPQQLIKRIIMTRSLKVKKNDNIQDFSVTETQLHPVFK